MDCHLLPYFWIPDLVFEHFSFEYSNNRIFQALELFEFLIEVYRIIRIWLGNASSDLTRQSAVLLFEASVPTLPHGLRTDWVTVKWCARIVLANIPRNSAGIF